jgi:hypothetical protein
MYPGSTSTTVVLVLYRRAMWMIVYVAVFVVGGVSALARGHHDAHGVANPTHLALAGFLVVNVMICMWEIALLVHVKRIKRRSRALLRKLPTGSLGALCLFEHMPLRDALSLEGWSEIWVAYSLCDTSYADANSFGWSIDTGNGISAVLPSALWCVCMTNHTLLSPKILGIIGIAHFWQMAYGTILYFFQYCYHKRWEKHGNSWGQILALVVASNVTWILFPALGMWASSKLILAESDAEAWKIFL